MNKKLYALIGLSCALCLSCSDDKGDNQGLCGNGACDAGETSASCPQDCATSSPCGNGTCDAGETSASCPQDCATSSTCGNGTCDVGETSASCPQDCSVEIGSCGDGKCDADESVDSCPADCICGNGTCDEGESHELCPKDCAKPVRCGDGSCDSGETRLNCPKDCPPVCGDGMCEGGEYPDTCPEDCQSTIGEPAPADPICGDGVCEESEKGNCDADCNPNPKLETLSLDEFNKLDENPVRFLFDYDKAMDPKSENAIDDFFAFPYPSEVRTDAHGRPSLEGYPIPPMPLLDLVANVMPSIKTLIPSLIMRIQTERAGFSAIGGVYFRTSQPIDGASIAKNYDVKNPGKTAQADSCFQLINVEENSTHYGERVPVYVTNHLLSNSLWAENTLVLRPIPGVGPNPGDRHVAVVTNCLTSYSRYINQSNKLRYILAKAAPKEINDKTSYYVDQLEALEKAGKLGFKMNQIRAFAGYDTMHPAEEMDQMAQALKGKGRVVADENGVAIGDGKGNGWTAYGDFNVFRGQFVTCNFIEGDYSKSVPNYTGNGAGEIRFDDAGKLVSTCKEEKVFFEVTVPSTPMPEKGYPIAVYGHGTGGDATTHSRYVGSEGIVLIRNGGVPMAMIGFDACLQGNRTSGEGSETELMMMMIQNPVVVRESVRQTVNDMLVLYDIIGNNKLILPPPPKSTQNVIFDPSYGLFMGHSQGSQEAGLLLGLTDSVKNAFLSAGGGGVLLSFVDLHPDLADVQVIGKALNGKSLADLLAYLFELDNGAISYDTFITNHIVQPLMDPVDPLNFTPRFIREPIAGMNSKNIAQTMGLGDLSTPQAAQFAMITSTGLPFVGEVFETSMPSVIAGLDKSAGKSVSNNVTTPSGKATGGAIQFNYTGTKNPHFVIYYMEAGKKSYIDFFKSVLAGTPTVSVSGKQKGSS